ncbi:MAG: hypothetical protein D4S02_07185 [Rhodocyclaceae bacterium]|nr:MAG: hypothetical protein D4S02_07185 [Rhodocyclaceae bacterium]
MPAFDFIGFWMPFLAALACSRWFVRDRFAIITTLLCAGLIALQFVLPGVQEFYKSWATLNGSTSIGYRTLFPFMLLYPLLGGRDPRCAIAGGFFSVAIPDVPVAWWNAVHDPSVVWTVGVDHWRDGLVLSPVVTAILTTVFSVTEIVKPDAREAMAKMHWKTLVRRIVDGKR